MRLRLVILYEMDLSIRLLILVLFSLVLGGSALTAEDLLNRLEASLLDLVKQVQKNDLNSCESLSTCNDESTCSRLTCPLTNADKTGYACQEVFNNTNCEGNCSWRNFDFSRSFLRVPGVQAGTENPITQRQLRGICAQRNLDNLFKNYSNHTNFFRLYFGSVDGTFRIFPGMDESDCGSFETRTRLWYLTSATNVKKAVMVLIDSGSSMTKTIATTGDSNLKTAYNITKSFLNTTTQDDYVNIFTFDEANVEPFSSQPVLVTNTTTHPDFKNFVAMLSSQGSAPPGNGNITDAVSTAITSLAGFTNMNISSDYLKVMILITDNREQDADTINNVTLPWELIKNNSINLFFYMLSPKQIDTRRLMSQLCNAQGYFEILNAANPEDPLLALEEYYSFVANVRKTYVNDGIDYSIEYKDFSEVDDETFTLSKAVFSLNNGEFLGVAAIDAYKTKLLIEYGIDGKAIKQVASQKPNQTNKLNAPKGVNTPTCLNKALCNQNAIASNIVCPSNFDEDNPTLQKLSCCNCSDRHKPPSVLLTLGLGLGLGIPALTMLAVVVAWFYLKNRSPIPPVFSGDEEDVPL